VETRYCGDVRSRGVEGRGAEGRGDVSGGAVMVVMNGICCRSCVDSFLVVVVIVIGVSLV